MLDEWFRRFSHATAEIVGRSWAFVVAVVVIAAWGLTGPLFHFSDTWQLVINTGTTIVTFLMVFLIQNTQNRDAHAIHLKLDELIRANKNARNNLLALESMSDADLMRLQHEFEELRDKVEWARNSRTSRVPPPPHAHARGPGHAGSPAPATPSGAPGATPQETSATPTPASGAVPPDAHR